MSLHDIEDLLAERGIIVSHEAVRFGAASSTDNMPKQSEKTGHQLVINGIWTKR
ncbi:MAG: hypothetical protein JKY45_04890 [Emcibacter sp.]|nr:hypothetical protein [Emcibacter sp.]